MLLVVTVGIIGAVSASSDMCATSMRPGSGCTKDGHYSQISTDSAGDCCAQCMADTNCQAWTWRPDKSCYFSTKPSIATNPDTKTATCGCRQADCQPAPVACEPVKRPGKAQRVPLPPGKVPPHIVTVLVDDLGFDDASIVRGDSKGVKYTPNMQALAEQGIRLDRHHTYLYCSPTRRAFLTGRYPVHISYEQAPTCSNLTPLQFSILSEKLMAANYQSYFFGKGHLGWQTEDNLLINRDFEQHLGFLGGGESYTHGLASRCGDGGSHDMWYNAEPAVDMVDEDFYNTNFFTTAAVKAVQERNASRPFWIHIAHQAVHTGANRTPPVWELWPQDLKKDYISSLFVLDNGIANVTEALKNAGMWDNTIFILSADNGGDCGLPAQPGIGGQPGFASNYPLLGRKCTAWDGGTRTAAFVSGGLVPTALRGTVNHALIYVTDWYPTLCKLAGVDPTDDWTDGNGTVHPIDGVDVWDTLMSGTNDTGREFLPTTERSIIWYKPGNPMYKLIVNEVKANRFMENGTQYMDTMNPCINTTSKFHLGTHKQGLAVPRSCVTCSPDKPCLFELLSDPSETKNIASDNSGIVSTMAAKLATFQQYGPALTPENLACYTCGNTSSAPPKLWWQGFSGPCCVRKP